MLILRTGDRAIWLTAPPAQPGRQWPRRDTRPCPLRDREGHAPKLKASDFVAALRVTMGPRILVESTAMKPLPTAVMMPSSNGGAGASIFRPPMIPSKNAANPGSD